MDTECKMSVEAVAIMGFDCGTVQLLSVDKPWHLMVEKETTNLPTAVEGDRGEKTATVSDVGGNYSVAEEKEYPILIDFEKICLWDHDDNFKVGIRMEDPVYMKKRLLEWVHAVAAYIRFLHASEDIT